MSSSDSPTIHRSISMPAKPQPLQTKPIKRSQEKETLIEQDYYPESPTAERHQISFDADNRDRLGSTTSQSANNFLTTEWAGSTVELNNDLRRNEVDTFYYYRKPYRVIEKNGRENVTFKKIPEKSWRYIRDFVTTLICHRDGKLCLLFRVCDPREQQTIESKIRVYIIIDKPTKEGELIKTHTELKLENNGQQIIIWPEIVCHVIDETSPLSHFKCAKDVTHAQFELYVSIVGVSAATAQITEARTSYVPREIFWGQRFINIIKYDSLSERYIIDFGNFNTTISVDMTHEAKQVEEIENKKAEGNN